MQSLPFRRQMAGALLLWKLILIFSKWKISSQDLHPHYALRAMPGFRGHFHKIKGFIRKNTRELNTLQHSYQKPSKGPCCSDLFIRTGEEDLKTGRRQRVMGRLGVWRSVAAP
jgi:hypothetical protein